MIQRFYFLPIILTSVLLSCTAENGRLAPSQGEAMAPPPLMIAPTPPPPAMDMAGSRGLNSEIMDAHLVSLIAETQNIEKQIGILLKRMDMIRSDIAAYNPDAFKQDIVVAGREKEVVLPVPERPAPIVHTKETQAIEREIASIQQASQPTKAILTEPARASSSGVTSIRTGIHADKTRLVLDMNGNTKHTIDFDKQSGVLTVTLPETPWSTSTTKTYNLTQVQGYEAKPSGQGTVLAISVKNTSRVKSTMIQKTGDKPARLILDLMK